MGLTPYNRSANEERGPEAYLFGRTDDAVVTLEDAVAALDEAVSTFLASEAGDTAPVLSAVFRLDNEIGRRLRPTGDAALRRLQLAVNGVAVAAKKRDRANVDVAMGKVRAEFLGTQQDG